MHQCDEGQSLPLSVTDLGYVSHADVAGWAAKGGEGLFHLEPCSRQDAENAVASNRDWLERCLVSLLCVLALDRFGDYISDQARLLSSSDLNH